jgi:hypothetical protein
MPGLTLDLFRSCKRNGKKANDIAKDYTGTGSLYPDYAGFTRKDLSFRAPDVTTFDKDEETWIRGVDDINPDDKKKYISPNEGVSLSNAAGKFGYGIWYYFLLPTGTEIPAGLDVKQTGRDAGHYSIRCRNAMTKTAYEGALDNVARSAIVKSVELGRESLYFKE